MRKTTKMLFALAAVALSTACTSEVDDVFDDSPAQRIEKAMAAEKQVLTSAQNGWLMEYYGNTDFGGYTVLCKFNADNTVTVASEIDAADKTVTSHYKLEQSQGVVLSFDEYNDIFHKFADPDPSTSLNVGTAGKGFEGDFEFRILKCTSDSIVMKGKKHGSRIVMTPFAGNWKEYIESVNQSEADMAFGSYIMVVGTDTATVKPSYRNLSVSYTDSVGSLQTINVPYIQRPGAYTFYEPLELFGSKVTKLTYESNDDFAFQSDDSRLIMKGVVKPLSQSLIDGEWYVTYSGLSEKIQPYWDYAKESLLATEGEVLRYIAFSGNLVYFMSGNYGGAFDYAPVIIDDNTVKYTLTAYGGNSTQQGNAQYYWADKDAAGRTFFRYFFTFFNGTFQLEADDLRNPTEITMTNVEDPDVVITLYRDFVAPY